MSGIFFNAKEDQVPFGDMIPLEDGELPTSAVLGVAWDYGWTRGVTSSIARFGEQFGQQHAIGESLYGNTDLKMLDPKAANEQYGVPGALSFSSPIRESVAQILRERKDEEIAQQFILDKAKGLQKAGVFTAELAAGVLDPAALMAGFIPIVPEATYMAWTQRSLVGGRAFAGLLEGAVGNALVEPVIYGQAQYEQAQYGPLDSLINIAAGGVFGSGLHVVGGKFTDWLHGVQMKHHLRALQTAINQTANGQKVQVEPIVSAEVNETPATVVDFDEVPTVEDVAASPGPVSPSQTTDVSNTVIKGGEFYVDDWSGTNPDTLIDKHVFITKKNGKIVEGVVGFVDDGDNTVEITQTDGSVTHVKLKSIQQVEVGDAPTVAPIGPEKVTPAPLVGDTTDGLELFAAAQHVEALNVDNLTPENVGQLGSNTGDVYTDSPTGKKFYVKLPPPEKVEQARQEFIAYSFYKMSGQDVPDVRPVLKDGEFIGVASEWAENAYTPKSQSELYSMISAYKAKDPDGFEKFARGIIIDMWLANWDWAAAGNIIFKEGVPIRIDYGGALQYRAMGSKKQAEDFSEIVTELKSFLDPASTSKAKIHNEAAWNIIQIAGDDFKKGVNDLALMTDDDISSVIWRTGLSADDAADISAALIARRIALMEKYGDVVDPTLLKSAEFFTSTHIEKFIGDMAPQWKPLSAKVSDALSNYKGSGYDTLNSWLRGKAKLLDTAKKQMEKLRDAMDLAVQGFAFPQEAYIWRGGVPKTALAQFGIKSSDDVAAIRKKLLGNGIGHTIADPAFLSTSNSKSFALSWMSYGDNTVALRIKVPKGQQAAIPLGNSMMKHGPNVHDGEFEFVLPRDTQLAITDVYKDKASGSIVVNTKVVPTNKIKPVKPEMAMKMAEKHLHEFSSAADDKLLDAELTYSLKESMKIDDADELVASINKNTSEVLQDIKKSAPDDEATAKMIEQIEEDYGTMTQQGNAMAKGAMAAYGCVLKNANL